MSNLYYQNSDDQLDVEELHTSKQIDKLHVESSHKKSTKQAFVSSPRPDECLSCPIVLHDDLMDSLEIYNLWMRTFSDDRSIAEQKWQQFRNNTKDRYDEFDKKIKKIESDIYINNDNDVFFDIAYFQEKKNNVDAVLTEIEKYNKEFSEISKLLEKFCQYLPKDIYRKRVDLVLRNLRVRYFDLVQDLHKKREILCWIIPRFQVYRSKGSEIKSWLDCVESRSKFLSSLNNNSCILENKMKVEAIADEINTKKDIYEDFLDAGNGILDIDHNMRMNHLEEDLEDVACRWDFLCEKIENCLGIMVEEEEKTKLDGVNKRDTDKIDLQIKDEYQQCTCCQKFQIEKVEDGRYTFGTTKTIRLLRIHGNSIVVRVGGGWEYLYNFLYKVDPCRAKQLAINPEKAIKRIKYLSGVSLIPADQNQDSSFTMSVQRMYRSSWVPIKHRTTTFNINKKLTASADHLDSAGDSLSSLSMSTTSSSSTSSIPHTVDNKHKQKNESMHRTPNDRYNSLSAGTHGHKGKLNMSTGSLNKKSVVRRVSLMERQSQYARKRCPSSASVLDH